MTLCQARRAEYKPLHHCSEFSTLLHGVSIGVEEATAIFVFLTFIFVPVLEPFKLPTRHHGVAWDATVATYFLWWLRRGCSSVIFENGVLR